MDKALVGVSVSNLNNTIGGLGVVAIGTSISALESNKADKLQVSTSASKYLQRNESVLPAGFTLRPDTNTNQPHGYNGSVPTDLTLHSCTPQQGQIIPLEKLGFNLEVGLDTVLVGYLVGKLRMTITQLVIYLLIFVGVLPTLH